MDKFKPVLKKNFVNQQKDFNLTQKFKIEFKETKEFSMTQRINLKEPEQLKSTLTENLNSQGFLFHPIEHKEENKVPEI